MKALCFMVDVIVFQGEGFLYIFITTFKSQTAGAKEKLCNNGTNTNNKAFQRKRRMDFF